MPLNFVAFACITIAYEIWDLVHLRKCLPTWLVVIVLWFYMSAEGWI